MFLRFVCAAVVGTVLCVNTTLAQTSPAAGAQPKTIDEIEAAGKLLMENKADEAFKSIQEAVKKYPTLPPARLILARMVLQVIGQQKGNVQQGRGLLEQAVAETPDHPEVYRTLIEWAVAEQRVTDIILNAQKMLELSESSRWTADQKKGFQSFARAASATGYEQRADWTNCKLQLAAWLSLDPKNGQARNRYATVLFLMDKPDEAFTEFQQAVKDDATLLPASVTMGQLYTRKNDPKKAGEWFDKAVKQDANNAKVHVAYADYLLQQDNVEKARFHTEQATRLDPKNIEVQRMQGIVARCARDYPTAVRLFEDMLKSSPADRIASNQLALILADMNDDASKKKAMQLAEVNARQYQNDLEAVSTYGYCLYRNGNVEQARQVLAKAVLNNQVTPDMIYYLALSVSETKEAKEEAGKMLKKALDSNAFFFFKKEAKALNDKLEKELKDAPKPKG